MAYRDENQALRARLEATEQRLRVVENELADARRRLEEEPASLKPSMPPRSSPRVGYPPPRRTVSNQSAVLAAVAGIVLLLAGSAFMLWNLPADENGLELLETLFVGVAMAIVPGLLLLRYALRPPTLRETVEVVVRPRVMRVTPERGVEITSGRHDVDLDGDVFGVELRPQHIAERRP